MDTIKMTCPDTVCGADIGRECNCKVSASCSNVLLCVGDAIEAEVLYPHSGTIIVTLENEGMVELARKLISNTCRGWKKVNT